jgi:hypothetical protein
VCPDPCLLLASKKSTAIGAIIGGLLGSAAGICFFLALMLFLYIKFGHKLVKNLINNLLSDRQELMLQDSPIYIGANVAQVNPISE